MKKNLDFQRKKTPIFPDKENEIAVSFQKINDLIEFLDSKMKEALSNQEKSLIISFDKVIGVIMKDMKTLKDNYAEAIHKLDLNINIIRLKKEIIFLKNQLSTMNDENLLLKKIISNYKKNVTNIQDDRNFEKSFVLETQRENKYLKITLDEIVKENQKNEENIKQQSNNLLNSFIFLENKTFKEKISYLFKDDKSSLEEKIHQFIKNFEILENQHNSEILTYKNENSLLKNKVNSLTKTNYKIYSKINGFSKIEKLFNESVEAVKEKIFLRQEKSKNSSFGQSNLQTTINNSNISKMNEIIHGIDIENFTKFDKIDMISSFFSNEKFISFVKELVLLKKCCSHPDCFLNSENATFFQEDNEKVTINKFSNYFNEIKKRNNILRRNKTEINGNHTERVISQPKLQEKQNYLNLTSKVNNINKNEDLISSFNERENPLIKANKSKSLWIKEKDVTKSTDFIKSHEKLFIFFRRKNLKREKSLKEDPPNSHSLNQITKHSKILDIKTPIEKQDINDISFC